MLAAGTLDGDIRSRCMLQKAVVKLLRPDYLVIRQFEKPSPIQEEAIPIALAGEQRHTG